MIDENLKLINTLGKGGSSKVFNAVDLTTQRRWAVKVLNNDRPYNHSYAMNLIRREFEINEMVAGHPNIIQPIGYNTEGVILNDVRSEPIMYNVLELAENGEISRFIRETGPLEEEIGRFYAVQICHAINFMHQKEIAHLDVKLENILLDGWFNAKLADFGSAINAYNGSGLWSKQKGTLPYMAPEVRDLPKDEEYDIFLADAFSLGATIFTMLIGEFPLINWKYLETDTFDSDCESSETFVEFKNDECKKRWDLLSDSAKELIQDLLEPSDFKRMGVDDACEHEWIKSGFSEDIRLMVYQEMSARKAFIISHNRV